MYKPSYDMKFIILVTLFLLFAVSVLVYSFFDDSPRATVYRTFLIPVIGIGVPMIILLIPKIRYVLHEDELVIKTGVKDFIVKYETMKAIHPTSPKIKNIAKSANSNAIRVITNFSSGITITLNDEKKPMVQITPENKEKFLQELQEKVPNLNRSEKPL